MFLRESKGPRRDQASQETEEEPTRSRVHPLCPTHREQQPEERTPEDRRVSEQREGIRIDQSV